MKGVEAITGTTHGLFHSLQKEKFPIVLLLFLRKARLYPDPQTFVQVIKYRLNGLKNHGNIYGLVYIAGKRYRYCQHGYYADYPVRDRFQKADFS
jgi:hypothetical protein